MTFEPPGYVTFLLAAQRVLKELGRPNDRPRAAADFMRRAAHCGAPPTYFLSEHGSEPEPMTPGRWRDDVFYRAAFYGRTVYWQSRGSQGPFKSEGRALFRSDDLDRLIAWARPQSDPLQITAPDWRAAQEATAASVGSGALIEGNASPRSPDDDPEGRLTGGDDDRIEAAIERAIAGGGVDDAPQLSKAEYLSEPQILSEWNIPDVLFDAPRAEILQAVTSRKLPMRVRENGVLRPATKADLDSLSTHSESVRIPTQFRFERHSLCRLPSLGLPPDEAKRQLEDERRAQRERALAAADAKSKTANDRAIRRAEEYDARPQGQSKWTPHKWADENAERLSTKPGALRKDVAKGLKLLAARQNQTVQPAKPDGPAD